MKEWGNLEDYSAVDIYCHAVNAEDDGPWSLLDCFSMEVLSWADDSWWVVFWSKDKTFEIARFRLADVKAIIRHPKSASDD